MRPCTTWHSLAGNGLCGVYLQYGSHGDLMGTYNAAGITALCEGLKGSAVTSLECAAAPSLHADCTLQTRRSVQPPMNTSDMPPLGAHRQARSQRHPRGGRQGDRRRAQGLSAVYAEVHPRTLPARNVTTTQTPEPVSYTHLTLPTILLV